MKFDAPELLDNICGPTKAGDSTDWNANSNIGNAFKEVLSSNINAITMEMIE